MAQDFFSAFGRDDIGAIGTDTTITSTDMDGILMIAAQALEKRTLEQKKEIQALRGENADLRAETADLKARLAALERKVGNSAVPKAE
jgi:predicted  nucleic acid-binding Zn-ribbon protein